jgi:hypothetical protein
MRLGDLHADIKNNHGQALFVPGPIANFLNAFAKGEGHLPSPLDPLKAYQGHGVMDLVIH